MTIDATSGYFRTGPARILVAVAGSGTALTANALYEAGYTRNGAEIRVQPFMVDCHSDDRGGEQGPPGEIQHLGTIVHIRAELSRFNNGAVRGGVTQPSVIQALEALAANWATATNAMGIPGTMCFAEGLTVRVVIDSPSDPRDYPLCIVRQPVQYNKGTIYEIFVVEFEAHLTESTSIIQDAVIT